MKWLKEFFQNIYWSWKWGRDLAWRKRTLKRLEEDRKRCEAAGKKFVNTALRRFVDRKKAEADRQLDAAVGRGNLLP